MNWRRPKLITPILTFPRQGLRGVGIHPHPNPLPEGEGVCCLEFVADYTFAYPCEPVKGEGTYEIVFILDKHDRLVRIYVLSSERGAIMLIKHTPDAYEKLRLLGGMATDDILTQPESRGGRRGPYPSANKNPTHGVYRASMPNGKYISLMRVMFTDFCKMDCAFCPNSHWVPRKRYAFKVDELARTFAELARRQTVSGLFLSSGVAGDGSKTTDKMVKVVDAVRNKYGFKGYIHLKVMPGTEYEYVEAAYRLGTRLSVNMETPTEEHMRKLSAMKDLKRDIMDPMEWIHKLTDSHTNGAVGQVTQLVVGAADESDRDIFGRMDQLYSEWNLKRIYYAPFRPVRHTPLEEHPATPYGQEPQAVPDGLAQARLSLLQRRA